MIDGKSAGWCDEGLWGVGGILVRMLRDHEGLPGDGGLAR